MGPDSEGPSFSIFARTKSRSSAGVGLFWEGRVLEDVADWIMGRWDRSFVSLP
jgi:hypothetical protein